ncbi:MAG TPA: hypothetical protein VKG84_07065 [Candidatus Acidoferrales bacterium]|nr:hypothetical protein [Candidatus Acidoferrales bacterium]
MAIRKCPACLTTASMGVVAAHTNDFVCTGCGQHLEVREASRVLAAVAGIAAGYFSMGFVPSVYSTLGWAVPALFGLLAYGCVSALVLMVTADLRVIPAPAAARVAAPAAAASHGHH